MGEFRVVRAEFC